jgi:hypothetical protein
MTWKSYAAVSGATVLAGWLASAPPANAPASAASASRQAARPSATAPSDIEQQAMRLQARLRAERAFREPERNPFRFGARRSAAAGAARAVAEPESPAPPPVNAAPPAPLVSLSGIAEDRMGDRVDRTAILSSPAGVLLVHEGDEILGYYRIGRIETEAVELIAVRDGATRRLTLGTTIP